MRLLLVHNPAAGPDDREDDALIAAFERAGHSVAHVELDGDAWQSALDTPVEAVVAAGGDGTIRAVVIALARRRQPPPLAILPAGTANNIGRTFVAMTTPDEAARRLAGSTTRTLTVGRIAAPWGTDLFVEAAGVGVFARMLREAHRHPEREQPRREQLKDGAAVLLDVLRAEEPRQLRVEIDGRDLSGEYWLVEAMNIPSIGARLELAPAADTADDHLDVVMIGRGQKPMFEQYLEKLSRGEPAVMPDATVRGRNIVLGWPDQDGHIDDQPWPDEPHDDTVVTIDITTSIPVLV